jgi:hypothetical protein
MLWRPPRRPQRTEDPDAQAKIAQLLNDPNVGAIWFPRNTLDVSPDDLNMRVANEIGRQMRLTAQSYKPFSPLESRLMRTLGMRDPPGYFSFHELLEFRR